MIAPAGYSSTWADGTANTFVPWQGQPRAIRGSAWMEQEAEAESERKERLKAEAKAYSRSCWLVPRTSGPAGGVQPQPAPPWRRFAPPPWSGRNFNKRGSAQA